MRSQFCPRNIAVSTRCARNFIMNVDRRRAGNEGYVANRACLWLERSHSICRLLFRGVLMRLEMGSMELCHIFHNNFKNGVDSFGMWGLYTDTTRAGRRWRLPNAPISQEHFSVSLTALESRFCVSLGRIGLCAWFVLSGILMAWFCRVADFGFSACLPDDWAVAFLPWPVL